MAQPLKIETRYVVRIAGATNLIGKKGGGDIGFTVPKPVPVDTTRRGARPSAADTTRRAPLKPVPPPPPPPAPPPSSAALHRPPS